MAARALRLHKAAHNGKLDVIAALIKAGADVNTKGKGGILILDVAYGRGKHAFADEKIAALKEAGAVSWWWWLGY